MDGNRKTTTVVVVCALMTTLCSTALGRIIYVDDDAAGANDGSSWADAYVHLQDALVAILVFSEPVEIHVGQGTYRPDLGAGLTPGDRTVSFQLASRAVLRGGYAGLGTPDPNERNTTLYASILSGDLLGDDSGFTDAQGKFACTSDPLGSPGTGTEFVFVVDRISKPGWFYDESSSETTAVAVVQ